MAYINQWNLSGNVGRDAELKTSKAGAPYADFSLAVNTKGEGGEDETMWVRVHVFGKNAERAASFCKKGANVFVTGPMKKRKYTKRDGTETTEDYIPSNNFTMLKHTTLSNTQTVVDLREVDSATTTEPEFNLPY